MDAKIQKPFLKWVGGKTQIIDKIIEKFPKEMNNYHELFLGGGSVLFALLSFQKLGKITIVNKIYAYDINENLIHLYKNIQHKKEDVYEHLSILFKEYENIDGEIVNRKATTEKEARTSKESYYYWIRNSFNKIEKNTPEHSAVFLFLNKLCFRGVYREGPKGFNVPFGHYKTTPKILTLDELGNISDLIKDVEFIHSNFKESIKLAKNGDFLYLDPPYVPLNSKSFVKYNKDGFSLEMHELLFVEIKNLDKDGIKFVMSNSNTKMVKKNFESYSCDAIEARRAINSKNPGSKVKELIVYNL